MTTWLAEQIGTAVQRVVGACFFVLHFVDFLVKFKQSYGYLNSIEGWKFIGLSALE